jgi:hypothetical protein
VTVFASNPMEARIVRMLGYDERRWRFVKQRDRARSIRRPAARG